MLLLATKVWEQRKLLSNIENIIDYRGKTPKKLGLSWNGEREYPALSAINVENGKINLSKTEHFGDAYLFSKWMKKALKLGQVILTTEAPVGNVAQINEKKHYILSQRVIAFETDKNLLDDFLYFLLQRNNSTLLRYSTGGTAKGISQKSLKQVKVNLTPNISEQKQISLLLNVVKNLITLYDRKKELLKKFQQGFSDILFKKNSKECVSLGDCFYFNKGKNIGNKDLINNGKYYAIVYGELYTTYNYVISKVSSKTSVKGFEGRKNDLLFPSSSTVPFGTATCSALKVDNIELGNDIIIARPKDTNKLDSAFISYQINSKRKILYPIISGTTITHMYSKDLSKIKIWLPSIVTQKYISNILQRIDRLNLLVDKKINILKAIKKELLNTMFI